MSKIWSSLQKQGISNSLIEAAEKAEMDALNEFQNISDVVNFNQLKVLNAFRKAGISELHLKEGTGYGYGDLGRGGLEEVYALAFGAEAALARAQIVSGTHAIAIALTAFLNRGDLLLSVTGRPYDTLARIIGIGGNSGRSLRDTGVEYTQIELTALGQPDYDKITEAVRGARMVLIQRSRGYNWRRSLSVEEIGRLIALIQKLSPNTICLIDNCYGEFAEELEPTEKGADLIAGSLIKNAGGGLAPSGGYLLGKTDLVTVVADRLIAPGLGHEIGTNLGLGRLLYQGFFMAPHIVGEALKGAVFASHFLTLLGMETSPKPGEAHTDIVQAVKMPTRDAVIAFCRGIQASSPVDSFVVPEPGFLPGYQDQIIMAAGTFIQGSSIELSADAPMREPYTVYIQGGLSFSHAMLGLLNAAQMLMNEGYFNKEHG
jgi:cystathionine beta-lyase family protein involved in aluminum resistance